MKGLIANEMERPEPDETAQQEGAEAPAHDAAEGEMPPSRNKSKNAEEAPEGEGDLDKIHSQIVEAAMTVMYDKDGKGGEQLVQTVTNARTPSEGLANATITVMKALQKKAPAGIKPESLVPAAVEILGLLAEDVEKITGQPIPGREIAQASQLMLIGLMKDMGVDVQEIAQAVSQVDYEKIGQAIDAARNEQPEQPEQAAPEQAAPEQEVTE
jgi:hypothetical protein